MVTDAELFRRPDIVQGSKWNRSAGLLPARAAGDEGRDLAATRPLELLLLDIRMVYILDEMENQKIVRHSRPPFHGNFVGCPCQTFVEKVLDCLLEALPPPFWRASVIDELH